MSIPEPQTPIPRRSRVGWVVGGLVILVAAVVVIVTVVARVTFSPSDDPVTVPLESFALTGQDLVPRFELADTATLNPERGPFVTDPATACSSLGNPPVGVSGHGAVGVHRDLESGKSVATTSVMVFMPPADWHPSVSPAMTQACQALATALRQVEARTFTVDDLPSGATAVYFSERHDGKAFAKVAIRGVERGIAVIAEHHTWDAAEQSPQKLLAPALALYRTQRQRILDAA